MAEYVKSNERCPICNCVIAVRRAPRRELQRCTRMLAVADHMRSIHPERLASTATFRLD